MDPAKLKVVELRSELTKRGLDSKGNKPVLVERLRAALEQEKLDPSKAPSETSERSEQGSESEEEEPARPPPRTPGRSSRHASREPVTPARTPTRRSSSRSSLSRQSPAKSTAAEIEAASALEPIVEEEKPSPKKETVPATPKREPIVVLPKTELAPVATPKKDTAPAPTPAISPKKEAAPAPLSPKKEAVPTTPKGTSAPTTTKDATPVTTPKKDDLVQNESPKPKTPEVCGKSANAESPVKTIIASPIKPDAQQSPVKPETQSPAKSVAQQSPVKPDAPSPAEPVTQHSSDKSEAPSPAKPVTQQSPAKPITQQSPVKSEAPSPAKPVTQQSPVKSEAPSPAKAVTEQSSATPETQSPVTQQSPAKLDSQSPVKPATQQSPVKLDSQSPAKSVTQQSPAKMDSQSPAKPVPQQSPAKLESQSPSKPITQQSPVKQAEHQSQVKQAEHQSPVKVSSPQKNQQSPTKIETESPSKKLKTDADGKNVVEEEPKDEADARKSNDDAMEVDQENDAKSTDTDGQQDDKEDRKRKRSPSPREEAPRAPPVARPENEPTYDENAVLLSWYDSDLNLVIDSTNYFSASSMQGEGFNYMWAGARATHGFAKGKVFYEARVHNEFDNIAAAAALSATNTDGAIPVDEHKIPSILRLGWSTMGTSLQLGEEKFSYGYEGTGKKSTNNVFEEYGKTFAKNDVIGCYADFDTDGNVTLTYTVNGESQGPAFNVKKEELGDKALYPHVLGRNCSFKVNFGHEDPWSNNVLDDYQSVGKVDLADRVVGNVRPEKRADCEIILLCGLPFSGKTDWAIKHITENPDKAYCVLGTHNLIERMKVEGKPLKDNFKGRWETVVEKCSRALTKLVDAAPSRRRNYILDQTANIYGSMQKRKMRNFYGFHRKAIVLVPSDEELKSRITKRKEESGEEIRESSLLEMKANLSAPAVGESFEEVIWAALEEEEGKKLIENYNIEGKTAGYGQNEQQNKRPRFDSRNNRDSRDHRRPGFNDRRSVGPWRQGPGGGGGGGGAGAGGGRWDGGNRMRGGPMRHGGQGNWQGNWQGRGGPSNRRPDDRRQGNDRNRQGGNRGSGWSAGGYQGNQTPSVWNAQGNWQGSQWSGQQQGSWGGGQQQQAWGGAGAWKGYNQNYSSGTGSGNQSGGQYGNGNWNNWNTQYYNQQQYGGGWGGQQQSSGQSSGQTQPTGGTQSQTATKK